MWRLTTIARIVAAGFMALAATGAGAASLQVSPVTVDIPPPGAAAAVTLRNTGSRPLSAQIRVVRWTQEGGADRFTPATEVVASPPAATMGPGQDYAVRIIRLDKTPVAKETAYRLLVDELPDPAAQTNGAVALVVRYSIPVFFNGPEAAQPRLAWSIDRRGGRLTAVARNDGGRRLRIAKLRVKDGGRVVSVGDGLAGYVLAGATMRFVAPAGAPGVGGRAAISAETDLGPLDATASGDR